MKICRFDRGRYGVVVGDEVVDVSEVIGAGERTMTALASLSPSDLGGHPRCALQSVSLEAPVAAPSKIVAAPVNYRAHQEEMSQERPSRSVAEIGVFLKAPSSVVGPGAQVLLPYLDRRTDQEAELAAVIGTECRHVDTAAALDFVLGYMCLLDITVRGPEERSMRKSYDTFTPIGPWVTTRDEIDDPGDLDLRCWVNGELRQEANTGLLIVGLAELISYVSDVMTLLPGDIVTTGTPAGVGPITDGDEIAMEITGLGRLEVTVSAERAARYAAPVVS